MRQMTDIKSCLVPHIAASRPRWPLACLAIAAAVFVLPSAAFGDEPVPKKVDFNFEVRPILSDKCFKCHGPDPRNRKAGLRLDIKEGAFGTTKTGSKAVVPGNLDESELISRITAVDKTERMPPESLGRTLSPGEIELLKRWVEQGAPWQAHWSFLTPVAAPLPKVNQPAWPRNAIDHFVLARLEAERLSPAHEADKETLIRRLSFDLTGLPPTARGNRRVPGRPSARRLRSPGRSPAGFATLRRADGGRLARPGALRRHLRLSGRRLSGDVALARLGRAGVQHQLALRPVRHLAARRRPAAQARTRSQILATAFNRHHRQTNEGGSIEEEFRVEYVADRTNTFATAFLGLTLECARCHSHKYDPITQTEYYQFFSFFNSIDESGLYSHFTNAVPTPTLQLTTPELSRALAEIDRRIKQAEADLEHLAQSRRGQFEAWLASPKRELAVTGMIGDFPLECHRQRPDRQPCRAPKRQAMRPRAPTWLRGASARPFVSAARTT